MKVTKKEKKMANKIVSRAKKALIASLDDAAFFGCKTKEPITLVYFDQKDWKWIQKNFSLLNQVGLKANVLICFGKKSKKLHYLCVKYIGISDAAPENT